MVYGDIGTSPLYALRESLAHVGPSRSHVLGVVSLVFWSLVLVVVVKYLTFILRADNHGEGGVLALLTLARRKGRSVSARKGVLLWFGLAGAALLLADGMITPAISVLSAVEGLEVAAPGVRPLVIPIAIVILIGLFSVQKRGTGRIGALFGPAVLVWFVEHRRRRRALDPARSPRSCWRVDPRHGLHLLFEGYARLHGARQRRAVRDRRRGALRGPRPLRRAPDPLGLVRGGVSRRCCSATSARAPTCSRTRAPPIGNIFFELVPDCAALSDGGRSPRSRRSSRRRR